MGNNGGAVRLADDTPWEEVRAVCWELLRCRDLAQCAVAVRVVDGERLTVGYSEAKLIAAIDLAKMVDRLGREIGYHRQQRFQDWVAGHPKERLGRVEQTQLKADVRRVEDLVTAGGYSYMLGRGDAG